jgi:hypothetical protein
MRKLTLLLLLVLLLSVVGRAQTLGGGSITVFAGAPSGSCLAPQQAVNSSTGALYSCTASAWTLVSGGGGGLGTSTNTQLLYNNAGTAGGFGAYNNATNALTLPGSLAAGSDGVHPSTISLLGNTTAPVPLANTVALAGPTVTTFTNYVLQFPSVAPTNGQYLGFGAPSSNVIPVVYGTPSGGGSSQLDNQAPTSATTGNGAVQNMYTTTLASGLAAGACVELRTTATSGGTGTFDIYLLIGATQVDLFTVANGNVVPTNILLCNKPGVQNAQYWMLVGPSIAGNNGYFGSAAINFATSQTIGFGGKIAATGTWTGQGYQVEAQ